MAGKDVFLGELHKNMKTFIKGAVKDSFNYDIPEPMADKLAKKFGVFFGGMIEEFSGPPPQNKRGGGAAGRKRGAVRAAKPVSPRRLEGKSGLYAELPLMVPCRIEDNELFLDLDEFNFWEEIETLMEEWKEDESVQIKICTEDGSGPAHVLDSQKIEVTLNVGDMEEEEDDRDDDFEPARSRSARW
jgi:hypothetical protein